ncbi:MAG TPA: RraA family protein [Alphaproteobacteria bacterium]|jgi:regulator of RNase E activity RraA|nr:RraA family protein [Alphaproteobacteria bacterium]
MTVSDEILERARGILYTPVISDTLDSIGILSQALPPGVRPLDESLVLCGRARTGLYMPVYHDDAALNVYEHEIALVDDLKPGDVAVFSCAGHMRIAPWGELLSTAARARGGLGCVTDGLVRDVRMIREMKFPVFAGGIGPLDTKGRAKMMLADVPAEIGGAVIAPGDIVFGDVDGVVAIPQGIAEEVLATAMQKVASENQVRGELEGGAKLKDVFDKYGIL